MSSSLESHHSELSESESKILKETKELLRKIEEVANLGHWEINLITGKVKWSDQFFKILGFDPSKQVATVELGISTVHPEDRERAALAYQEAVDGNKTYRLEKRIVRPSGEIRHVLSEGVVEQNENGETTRLFGIFRDITEDKIKEEALFRSTHEIENILNTAQDLIVIFDLKGQTRKVSKSSEKILGYDSNWLTDRSLFDFICPEDLEITEKFKDKIVGGEKCEGFTNRYLHADGQFVDLSWSCIFDADTQTIFAIGRDISQLIKTKENLKKDQQKLSIVLNTSPDIIWALDKDYKLITFNDHFVDTIQEITNSEPKAGDNTVFDSKLPLGFIQEWKEWYDRALGGEVFSVIKKVTLFKKKSYLEINFKPIVEEGQIMAVVCYAQDISKHKEEEVKMAELVKRLNHAQKIGKLGYWEFDPGTEKIFWSDEVYKIWDMDKTKFNPNFELFFQSIHPDDRASFLVHHQNALMGKEVLDAVHRIILPSGRIKFVHEKGELEADIQTGNLTFRGTVQDISLDKEKELLLHQKTRLISATSRITASLLEAEDWQKILNNSLQFMGETVESEMAYLIKLTQNERGELISTPTHRWMKGQATQELEDHTYQSTTLSEYPDVMKGLQNRRPFYFLTKDTPGATGQRLSKQHIKSLLMVPVYLGESVVFCLVFEDRVEDRIWSTDELNFMHAASTNLSLALERKMNLDQTKEAYETRNSLLESIGESFYALDKNYLVTYWNNSIEKLTHIKREEILGKCIWDFVGEVNNEFKSAYKRAFEEDNTQYFETFDAWLNAWLEVTMYPANSGISIIIKDITSRKNTEKRLAESLDRFAIITNAANDAIWDWNIITNEHFWGEGFNKLFGVEVDKDGVSSESWDQRVHPDDYDITRAKMDEIFGDPEISYYEMDYRFRRQDGSHAYVRDKGSIIRKEDGTPIRIAGAIQDNTHRKAFEESLKILNSELANSNRELEISNKELEQFAYVASHDLQEPLRMITSFLGLIERKYKDSLDEKGLQYIHFAVNGAKRMRKIILDLLEFSTLGNLTDTKKPTDMDGLLQEVIQLNKKTIEETQAILHLANLPVTVCHPNSMIQLFQNLISNGIKYQPEGQIPEIWITGKELPKAWQFEIRDNGIGIEPEFREKVFIIFQRLHQKEQFSGSGIGLAICKKIVEFHGGKIWIESTPDGGSAFFFTIQK